MITIACVQKRLYEEFQAAMHTSETMIVNFDNGVAYAITGWFEKDKTPLVTSVIQNNEVVVSFSSNRSVPFHQAVDVGMMELIVELGNKKD